MERKPKETNSLEENLRLRLVLAALVIVLFAWCAYAGDTVVTFNASGTFADGATLSGTLTLDTTTGEPMVENLVVSSPDSNTYTVPNGVVITSTYQLIFVSPAGLPFTPVLQVTVPASTLVGYSGGTLCSTTTTCGAGASISAVRAGSGPPYTFDNLTSGSLTPAGAGSPTATAPALSPWALGGLALLLAASAAMLLRRAQQA